MTLAKIILPMGLLLSGSTAFCQQTGTVVGRTPSSAARAGITVTRIIPKAICETPGSGSAGEVNSLPEMLFARSWDNLVCVRRVDGKTEQLRRDMPDGVASADGNAIAYWNSDKHELHVFLTASGADTVVESLPGANLRGLSWSRRGRTLSYFPTGANPPGIRSFDVDSGKRNLFSGAFGGLVPSPDAEHVVAVSGEGVESFAIADGKHEIIAKLQYPWAAEYSGSGKFLGILGNTSIAEQNAPPTGTQATADDDGPDCTGGSSALIIQNAETKQLMDVPYPKGFDTVLDFAFSPDENAIAVTFGVVGCDYPGDRARIYLVSLPDLKLTPISSEDKLSVKPVWTPDGKTIVYSDYTGSDSPLVALELATRKVSRLTNPGQFGPDTWLAWR